MKLEKINDIDINDIVKCPDNYPTELKSVVLENLKIYSRQLYGHIQNLTISLMKEMEVDEATKIQYINQKNETMFVTLKNGSYECKLKPDEIERIIKDAGFDPIEFGEYSFKLDTWSQLKSKVKLGGAVKDLIEKLYTRGKKSLSVGDK